MGLTGIGRSAVGGGGAGLFGAGSSGGDGGGVSGNTVGEAFGLVGGDGSGLAGLSSITMGPGGGDTHRGLEVEGSLVAESKSRLLFLFLGLMSPTPVEVPGTDASPFSSMRKLPPNLLLGLIKTGLTAGDPGGRKSGVAVGEETVGSTGTTYPGNPTLAPENRRGVWVRMVSTPGNPFTGGSRSLSSLGLSKGSVTDRGL